MTSDCRRGLQLKPAHSGTTPSGGEPAITELHRGSCGQDPPRSCPAVALIAYRLPTATPQLRDNRPVDYDLARLGSREFEHMVQAIALSVLGTRVEVFGDGPDGGREATYTGLVS